jgi:hypothetical protein
LVDKIEDDEGEEIANEVSLPHQTHPAAVQFHGCQHSPYRRARSLGLAFIASVAPFPMSHPFDSKLRIHKFSQLHARSLRIAAVEDSM